MFLDRCRRTVEMTIRGVRLPRLTRPQSSQKTTPMTDANFRTPAWLLIGLTRSAPGVLEFADGRLAYSNEEGRVFDVPLAEVTAITFPWYYFSGGVKFTAGGEHYRLSFVRPNDASDIPGRLMAGTEEGAPFALLTAGRKVRDIGEGRRAGKAWKAILTGAPQS